MGQFYFTVCCVLRIVSYIPLYLFVHECPHIFISRDAYFIIALGTIEFESSCTYPCQDNYSLSRHLACLLHLLFLFLFLS